MTKRAFFDLLEKIIDLPKGQQRVAILLVHGRGTTYQGVAEALGVSIGTVYTHLKRIRDNQPETYRALMAYRQEQLERRHVEALSRARAHSDRWFRRKRNREFYYRFGCWPWER